MEQQHVGPCLLSTLSGFSAQTAADGKFLQCTGLPQEAPKKGVSGVVAGRIEIVPAPANTFTFPGIAALEDVPKVSKTSSPAAQTASPEKRVEFSVGERETELQPTRPLGANALPQRLHQPRVPQRGPQPTSPRRKMTDVLMGPNSVTRFPEQPTLRISPRDTRIGNFNRERGSPRESGACVAWLKQCQQDAHAEDRVEEMMTGNKDPYQRMYEQRVLREQLRRSTNRDATKCATTLAGRAKPTGARCRRL